MPQAHEDSQLHSSSSHHDRTHLLSSQGCHKHMKTVSFIPAPATMTELTSCQAQAHEDSRLNSSSSHHDRTYQLSSQGCHKHMKTVNFIPAPVTMTELTLCQAKDATST